MELGIAGTFQTCSLHAKIIRSQIFCNKDSQRGSVAAQLAL